MYPTKLLKNWRSLINVSKKCRYLRTIQSTIHSLLLTVLFSYNIFSFVSVIYIQTSSSPKHCRFYCNDYFKKWKVKNIFMVFILLLSWPWSDWHYKSENNMMSFLHSYIKTGSNSLDPPDISNWELAVEKIVTKYHISTVAMKKIHIYL